MPKKKNAVRSDGLIQRQVTINGKRKVFYGHSDREINRKIAEYREEKKRGAAGLMPEAPRFAMYPIPLLVSPGFAACG